MRLSTLVALLGLSGCSWIGVQSQPTSPWLGHGPVKCSGYGLPVADGVVAAAGVGFAGLLGGATVVEPGRDGGLLVDLVYGLPALTIGLIEAAAAIHGFRAVHRCRAEHPETLRDEDPVVIEPVALRRNAEARFYCTASTAGPLGSCSESVDACERVRAIHVASDRPMTACAERRDVSCFAYRSTDGAGHFACAPNLAGCEVIRGALEYRRGISILQECVEMPMGQQPQPPAPR